MTQTQPNVVKLLKPFGIDETIVSIKNFGNGHINDTLKVETVNNCYILQRINHLIFTDVDKLQHNIEIVTSHIRQKLEETGEKDIMRKVLIFLPTNQGKTYYFDGENYWRVCHFIDNSCSYDEITPPLSYEAGKAFGKFQKLLSDIPDGTLTETIPNFHNMEFRLKQFYEALQNGQPNRIEEVKNLIDAIEQRASHYCLQEKLYREGKLIKRINHCDTKVNNILFDSQTNEVLCVIDLDTVMPGFVLSDFGDFIRTAGNTGAEDDPNLDRVGINLNIVKAYAKGYIEEAHSFLTDTERDLLPYGAALLTYMQTVRFLTDYLNGDTYYKIQYPTHNLVRTKAQFKLLQSIETHLEDIASFINA